MLIKHTSWCSCFDEERIATCHCVFYSPYQQLSPPFQEVLPRNRKRIWCFSLPDRNLLPFHVLMDCESRGNNVTLTWESWRNVVFQCSGYRTLTKHAMEFCVCSMYLWVKDFNTCCHGKKSCTWLSEMIIRNDVCVAISKTTSQFQLSGPAFTGIYYWAVRSIFNYVFFSGSHLFFSPMKNNGREA